jgi:hypothetical protein
MIYCAFCDNEAEYVIDNTNTPICNACKEVYICGQVNPNAVLEEIIPEDED